MTPAHRARRLHRPALALALTAGAFVAATVAPAQSPPRGETTVRAASTIRIVGSSATGPLLSLMIDGYRQVRSAVEFTQTTGWTTTAIPALIDGTADIAPMSRRPRPAEVDAFQERFGYEPLLVEIARDAVAVFVHRDNPLPSVTMTQLDAIFSSTRTRGGAPIARWGDLGVAAPMGDQPLRTFGFSSFAAGSSVLRERVLNGGEFRSDLAVEPGPSAVVNAVGSYRNAIGYASRSVGSRRTRAVPIVTDAGAAVAPTSTSINDGSYPLVLSLYVAVNRRPGTPLSEPVRGFLEYALSDEGQALVAEAQLVPLPRDALALELAKLR